MEREIEPWPEPRLRDRLRTAVDAAVSAIPLVGAPAEVLGRALISPSIERRQNRWMQQLASAVEEIGHRSQNLDLEQLSEDESFVTAVLSASQIALGTHLENKIQRLRNFLVNLALAPHRDDFLTARLLRDIEELSDEHFVFLGWAEDPGEWERQRGLTPPEGVANSLDTAELPLSAEVLTLVIQDLTARGLGNNMVNVVVDAAGPAEGNKRAITPLGQQLLDMVRAM